MKLSGLTTFFTIIAVVIIVGLALRYGKSSIGLLNSAASGLYQETSLLTLANTHNTSYPYYGP